MPDKRRVFLNAAMSAAQVIVNAAAFLILYRYLLETIGEEQAGVWALVLSWTAALGVAELGLSGGAVKFVSRYLARGDRAKLIQVIHTSVLTVGLVLLIVLPAVYPALILLVEQVVEPASRISDALDVLPYAVASFWLLSVTNVAYSCIDGMQRVYLRNILVMASVVLYLGLALLLVPADGLIGLARAQVIQAAVILGASWLTLKFVVSELPLLPIRWKADVFKEMFGYGLNFQVISLSYFLFQPLTKSLLSKFGGVGTVFFFEMAQKLVVQLRAVVVTAHQSLVPAIAHLAETDRESVQAIYRESMRVLLFVVASALPILIGLTPLISRLWIGAYESIFIVFASLMFGGWFLNILSNPAYFGYLGIGRLRWNVIGHLTVGILNAAGGILLGIRFGAVGVVAAFAASIVIGSAITMLAYHRDYGIRASEVLDPQTLVLGAASLLGLAAVLFLHQILQGTIAPLWLASILAAVYLIIIALPIWTHPVPQRMLGWIAEMRYDGTRSSHATWTP